MLFLSLLTGVTHATEITLSVQPENPIANESFRLVFSAEAPVDAEPDFSKLEAVVDILGRNRQRSMKWINGRSSNTTTWILDVIAKTPGPVNIPQVAFGSDRSRAVTIQVHGAGSAGKVTDTGLLLEIEVDNENPYVQEQVILTARLLRRVELNDANLTDPSTSADAIIKRLGKDSTHQATRNGKRYEAFERRYALFPQTSGEVTIDPMMLTTQIVQSSRSPFDPFRQSLKTRRIQSNAIVLDVKPIPPSYTGATWLPAKRLRLRDDWAPEEATVKAGEPLTRTVFLWADGLNAGQLPELPIELPANVKSYPDQPQTSEQETEEGFSAIRQQKYAIIPQAAEDLVFPPTSITWWNTETDQMEVARLDERRFTVQGSPPASAPVADTAIGAADLVDPPRPSSVPSDPIAPRPPAERDNRLLIAAVVCFIGWLATALAWWLRSRRAEHDNTAAGTPSNLPALSRTRRDVLGACKANDPRGAKRALITWGRVAFDNPGLATLGDLKRLVGEPLNIEIAHLEDHLYGNGTGPWDQYALRQAFEHADNPAQNGRELQRNVNPLPDLFRLSGQ